MLRFAAVVLALVAATAMVESQGETVRPHVASKLRVPDSLVIEHHEIHEQMLMAVRSGGKTALAAEAVHAKLMPHFMLEEEFAMPPLGLLESLAKKQPITAADRRGAIKMCDRLRAEYPRMLKEHEQIVVLLKKLHDAAVSEKKPAQVVFVAKLKLHARNEEQILYPSALVLGERLKANR